jgi:hypothetical protein
MTTTPEKKTTGRLWAYIGLILGGLGSVAANIAHSFIAPTDVPAPQDWNPEVGAVVSAMMWPILLFIAIEILARTPWPTGMSWNLLRWVGLPPVALVAAVVSYRHLSGLLDHYGEEDLVVWLGPVAVDGLMFMATIALLATGKRHTRPTNPVSAPTPATDAPAPSTTDNAPATVHPAAAPKTPATTTTQPDTTSTATPNMPAPTAEPNPTTETPTPPAVEPTPEPVPVPATTLPPEMADLLPGARIYANAHQDAHGERITTGQLAVRLAVSTATAKELIHLLYPNPTTNTSAHNGTPIGANR